MPTHSPPFWYCSAPDAEPATAAELQPPSPPPRISPADLIPCPHRGESATTIPRRSTPCGCGTLQVWPCRLHVESVTIHPLQHETPYELEYGWQRLAEQHVQLRDLPPYRRRACVLCDACQLAKASDVS